MSEKSKLLETAQSNTWRRDLPTGWLTVADRLKTFWHGTFPLPESLVPYVRLLGDRDVDDVLDAVGALADKGGDWRPTPAQLAKQLNKSRPAESAGGRHGQPTRPDQTPEAHAAVRRLYTAGTPECACVPHPPNWNQDHVGVLRCIDCNGLETGQLDDALEAVA